MSLNRDLKALESLLTAPVVNGPAQLIYLCTEVPKKQVIDLSLLARVHAQLVQGKDTPMFGSNRAKVDAAVVQLGVSLIQQIESKLQPRNSLPVTEKNYLKGLVHAYHDLFPAYKSRPELREIFEDLA